MRKKPQASRYLQRHEKSLFEEKSFLARHSFGCVVQPPLVPVYIHRFNMSHRLRRSKMLFSWVDELNFPFPYALREFLHIFHKKIRNPDGARARARGGGGRHRMI